MTTHSLNTCLFLLIVALPLLISSNGYAEDKRLPFKKQEIKSYCIDFNWGYGRRAGFARPGTWKDADPKVHVDWYKAIGANVIQTFAVSCNGYAWYKSDVIPEQPGLKHDFLTDVVKLGHAEGMKVMGYFCIGANSRWGKENPTLSYGTPSSCHIPYTDDYLAYLSSAITDAIKTTGIDGFMIDWVWMPNRKATNGTWIDAEKELYQQLMGEPFPGEDKLTKEQNLAYGQKAIDRCWKAIHKAAKDANPNCIIWLTTNKVNSPLVKNSNMYKEVDWLMGETGKLGEILKLRPVVGKHTRLITCMSGFGGNDAAKDVPEAMAVGVGVYGYAKPTPGNSGGIIDLEKIFPKQYTELLGDSKRIAVMARAYRGKPVDTVWKDGDFVERDKPLSVQLKLRQRSSRHSQDRGRIDFEGDSATVQIDAPYHKGRAWLTRVGSAWPSSITLRLNRVNKKTPLATDVRMSNGKVGISIVQKDNIEVVAGKMQGMGKEAFWRGDFLNGGKPKSPVSVDRIQTAKTDEAIDIVIPKLITEGNPSIICIEWGIDGKVF